MTTHPPTPEPALLPTCRDLEQLLKRFTEECSMAICSMRSITTNGNAEWCRRVALPLMRAVDRRAPASQWIACTARMPEPGTYLVWIDGRQSNRRDYIAILTRHGNRWMDHRESYEPVTHWQPLPPPPSTETKP